MPFLPPNQQRQSTEGRDRIVVSTSRCVALRKWRKLNKIIEYSTHDWVNVFFYLILELMHMCVCVMCRVDVTEGQFGVMFVYCITALFGPDLWDVEVSCHLTKLFSKHCLSIFRCICLSNRSDWRHLCIHACMHAWSEAFPNGLLMTCNQCFDTVRWVAGRASSL